MSRPTVVVSLDAATLRRVDRLVQRGRSPTRSRAIEAAISAQLDRLERRRLIDESATLDPTEERALAEEGLAADLAEWPAY
jgi:metal-responsive CopG/Arc/MetJ family transcriptional regulator